MAARMKIHELLRPYRRLVALALGAMLVESAADLLEPWPLKVVLDYVIGSKAAPHWIAEQLAAPYGRLTVLNIAAAAVLTIAVVGAVSAYTEKYLSTTIGKRV